MRSIGSASGSGLQVIKTIAEVVSAVVALAAFYLNVLVPVLPQVLPQYFPGQTATPPPPAQTAPTRGAAPACTALKQTWVSPVDGMTLVCVPAGPFLMGAGNNDRNAGAVEHPQRKLTLSAFWLDQTEVTNAMYQLCVQAGRCTPPGDATSRTRSYYYGSPPYANFPVIYVSWNDAFNYCAWAGRGLPTEAQWEKAARGTEGQLYPWNDQMPTCGQANFSGTACVGDTSAVGSLPAGASAYGALDMAGNVWEWVADWYQKDYYSAVAGSDPQGPGTGDFKVLRGGAFDNDSYYLRATHREAMPPISRAFSFGFRCAR